MRETLNRFMLLLDRKNLFQLGGLFVAILGMALFEVIGIASILPFMKLVAEPDLIHSNEWLRWIYTTADFSSPRSMLIWTGGGVLALFTISTLFSAFTTWLIHRRVWSIAHEVSMRLLRNYAQLPYEFFLTHNSSQLLKKVVIDVNSFVSGVLLAGSQFVAYAVLSLVIFMLLLAVRPTLALAAFGLFGGAYILLHLTLHRYLKRLGEERLAAVYGRIRTFSDAMTGVKAIRTEGVAPFFIERFERASRHFSEIHPRYQLATIIPRYTIELLAFGAILATVLYWLTAGYDFTERIPVLTLFALAGYRLLPALTKAFDGAAQLSHHLPVIDEVYSDMREDLSPAPGAGPATSAPLEFERQIELRGIGFRYASAGTDVLSGIDLSIPKGAKVAFIGSTGSGKSTLIDIVVGLLLPVAGTFTVDGTPITAANAASWRRKVAYVPQDQFLYDDTITSNIAFGVATDRIDAQRIRDAARIAQIDTFIAHDLPDGYETVIGERGVRLSGGQRQRIGLARAFYRQPEVLLLDEATSALDGITEEAVMSALRDELPHLTVIMIAHRLSTVKFCQCIYQIDKGQIVATGSYDELLASSRDFRQMIELTSGAADQPRA